MSTEALQQRLDDAKAEVERLTRAIAAAPCSEVGHRWVCLGGANCGCEDGRCSVPVHECAVCGDSDYGQNAEADDVRAECADIPPPQLPKEV